MKSKPYLDPVKKELGAVTIGLHWLVALSILGMLSLGLFMTANQIWSLYPYHKSVGLLLVPIIAIRVVWRLREGWPLPVSHYASIERRLAKMTHWLLLILMVLMPLTGMIHSGASGHGFGIFGLELFPHQYTEGGQPIPYSESWRDIGQTAHKYFGYLIIALIALHIAGALKHHFIDKDSTLKRMLRGKIA